MVAIGSQWWEPLQRTHIPYRPRRLHCKIEEGMPKVLGCGVANIVPAKVEGQDHPGQHHDSKDWVLPKPPVFISQLSLGVDLQSGPWWPQGR